MKNKPSRRTFLQSGLAIPVAGFFNSPLSLEAASPHIEGRGGGQPSLVQMAGERADGLPKAMDAAETFIRSQK